MTTDHQPLVVAVDGGQSSTLAIAARLSGQILGAGLAGPSNHIHEPGGLERLRSAIRDSTDRALQSAGATAERVKYVCLGMTGSPPQARDYALERFPDSHIQTYGDLLTSLMGASAGQPGVVVIAGTGSAAFGRLADGREGRAGGWGYLIGDEGSAYAIGRAALQMASHALDGRGEPTVLLARIPAYFNLPDFRAVRQAVYTPQVNRQHVAGLSAIVNQAALEGDHVAVALLAGAGRDLASLAGAVLKQLDALELPISVFTTGGVFRAGAFVLEPFVDMLRRLAPASIRRDPVFSPVVGALLMALSAAGVSIDADVLDTIRATLPQAALTKHRQQEENSRL
jgi:N-acetylglucosamine kinase-like BadF-type ATPase